MYKENFKEWLELTWYLIAEPFSKLNDYFIDHIAPKWFLYILFKYKLSRLKSVGSHKVMLQWLEAVEKKNKLTKKQVEVFKSIIMSKPERVMETYVPDESSMFPKN